MDRTNLKQVESDYETALARWVEILSLPTAKNGQARIAAHEDFRIYARFATDKTLSLVNVTLYLMHEVSLSESFSGEGGFFITAYWEDNGDFVWGDDFRFKSLYHPEYEFIYSTKKIEKALRLQSSKLFKIVKLILS